MAWLTTYSPTPYSCLSVLLDGNGPRDHSPAPMRWRRTAASCKYSGSGLRGSTVTHSTLRQATASLSCGYGCHVLSVLACLVS
jgi:hypothetical protein